MEKQSSFFVEAKTAQSVILGNVFFNGPRAGINANDGFGGGDEIGHNLVFSSCRESGDHGPFKCDFLVISAVLQLFYNCFATVLQPFHDRFATAIDWVYFGAAPGIASRT